jgi:MFS family permease
MTFGGLQSTWGKLYKYMPIEVWYLIGILIFELGSIVCAVAKNPSTLIVGRAIQGVGGSGVTVGLFSIVGLATPPAKRPQYLGMVGAMYAIAAVMGPLLGGAFTERLTWRWVGLSGYLCMQQPPILTASQCFWINLPVGGIAAIVTFFSFKPNQAAKPVDATWKEKILQLDLVGASLMIALLTCYILALQSGGQTHPWKSSLVIGLFLGFVSLLAAFVAWELWQKEYAMIVPRIVRLFRCLSIDIVAKCALIESCSSQSATSGPAPSSWSSSQAPTSSSYTTSRSTSKPSTTRPPSARASACWP